MTAATTGRVRHLYIPIPASEDADADAIWLHEVQRIARARGIRLGASVPAEAKRVRHRRRALESVPGDPRTAPHPDRRTACSADLVARMKDLRRWAGNPSLRDLSDRAGVGRLPKSSISDTLNHPDVLPELGLLHAFVEACGGELHWTTHWFAAWQRLAAGAPAEVRQRKTDEMSAFDVGQLLLFAEKLDLNQQYGRKGARSRAAAQIPLVFDSPTLQEAVLSADDLLPSYLAMCLNMLVRRGDWAERRVGFTGAVRDAHLAEAERRAARLTERDAAAIR